MGTQSCRQCADVIEMIAEEVSLVCADRYRVLQALDGLRDGYERQQLTEAEQASTQLIEAMMAAAADGTITAGELQEIHERCAALRSEIEDVLAYDDEENELHHRAQVGELRARGHAARVSQSFNAADAAIHCRQNGGLGAEHPWLQLRPATADTR